MRAHRGIRSLALLIAGIAIGAVLVSPVGAHVGNEIKHLWGDHIRPLVEDDFYTKKQSNDRFIKASSVRKGFFSCPSTSWFPDESDDQYWTEGAKRYSTTSPISSFHCNAALPHGAKVKSVRFSMYDTISPDFVACTLTRRHLATHTETELAGAFTDASTGDSDQVDTSISKATIDNKNFGYTLRCTLFGSDDNIGFYGASVGYTLTATRGSGN